MAGFRKVSDLPQVIPVFPLDGAMLLPGGGLPLNIFEPRYLNMVDDALSGARLIGMVQTVAGGSRERPTLAGVGCAGKITSFAETGDGRYLITLTGIVRFNIARELLVSTPYRQIVPDFSPYEADLALRDDDEHFDRQQLLAALKAYLDRRGLEVEWETAAEAPGEALVNSLAMALPFDPAEKQALLEARTCAERREILIAMMRIDAAAPLESGDDDDDDAPPSMQ
jgi:Lon protease-like protein